jgi:lambda repressor-like predicted transcriptional regulator
LLVQRTQHNTTQHNAPTTQHNTNPKQKKQSEMTLPIARALGVPPEHVYANRMNWQVCE